MGDRNFEFSVLLSVYKSENPDYFEAALRSIWDQQIKKPTQIVLVVDGEIDRSLRDVIEWWESRLAVDAFTVVWLPYNVGLGSALNEGLKYCRYDLVARMDTDDISLPSRFQEQVQFMLSEPSVAASSCFVEEWDAGMANRLAVRILPLNADQLKRYARRRCPLSHPATIYRKSAVMAVGGYPPLRKAQDYALWSAMLQKGMILRNIDSVLFRMRVIGNVSSKRGWEHLKAEYAILRYQRQVGFIGSVTFLINLSLRSILRLSPGPIKALLYRYGR